jgi:archaellum component FlaG (FlaF/FlaG flagellin family)
MYTKLTAIMLVAALAAVLITSTIALSDDANARKNRNSQSLSQVNNGCSQCNNVGVQNQGDGNSVAISISQSK